MGYVNIKEILNKYQIEYKNRSLILCLNATRNNGKSTAAYNFVFEENQIDEENKVLLIRNTEEEIKNLKQDFNSRFFGKYAVSGSLIYSVINKGVDKFNEPILKKGKHIGYIGAISTYQKLKSVQAKDIKYVIYDEYADKAVFDIYDKFISMLKTFERFSKVFVIMLGNRETANNEFMNKWGVIPNTEDFDNDRFVQFSTNGYFIELGNQQFEDLNNDKCLANELAKFDFKSNLYLNEGAYKFDSSLKVVPFKNLIIDRYILGIAYKNVYFALVELSDGIGALIRDQTAKEELINQNIQVIAFDNHSYIEKETVLVEREERAGIVKMLVDLHKQDKLLYDSFDCLEMIKDISIFLTP